MKASDYLKMKLQSDRQLAVYGQQGVISTWKAMKGIGSDIYSGGERVSWYSSCLIPRYHDVCGQLYSEEKRMMYSIRSIYRYRDVIVHIFYLYFQMVIDDTENGNSKGIVRSVDSTATRVVARMPESRAVQLGLAVTLAEALSMSDLVSRAVVERLAARVPGVVWMFQIFGTEQKCALAARRLKTLAPKYFAILYNAELEMLYYFLEPVLSEVIKNVKIKFYQDFDECHNAIKSKYHV
ncbi:hypothetical protein MMK78_000930 [Raoultella planticola]|uniref:hypothetical protein n=1 Tax=Raoultella planticola TaxID=575 RepID=UPI0010D7A2A1|nr:hypothetical protein [Raoultella planticola]EIY2674155.1 hypothetical protein [Raoultella planticola]VTM96146.1 Uncharacterised protein [Raoultella planticola]